MMILRHLKQLCILTWFIHIPGRTLLGILRSRCLSLSCHAVFAVHICQLWSTKSLDSPNWFDQTDRDSAICLRLQDLGFGLRISGVGCGFRVKDDRYLNQLYRVCDNLHSSEQLYIATSDSFLECAASSTGTFGSFALKVDRCVPHTQHCHLGILREVFAHASSCWVEISYKVFLKGVFGAVNLTDPASYEPQPWFGMWRASLCP